MNLKGMQWVTKSKQLRKNNQKKHPSTQLEASKSSVKDLFNDLLDETKGFKYQITLKVQLKNTKVLKLNLLQFLLIQQQKQ